MKLLVTLCWCCALFWSLRAEGVPAQKKNIIAVRTPAPIVIDGLLSEPVWRSDSASTEFLQRDPVEGAAATERMEVRVAYDADALYVGARMFDAHPDSIVSRLERKDNDTNSDYFLFFVDPYNDKRSGYYFGVNAAGTLYDGTMFNDDWDSNSWDGVWECKTHIDDKGWAAEYRIPFSQLRFFEQEKYLWGVNFKRGIERKHEQDYLILTPKNGSGFVSRFAALTGIENIESPRRFEFIPYLTGKGEYLKHDAGDPFHTGSRYNSTVGADMKFGLGSNLTVDATVNPDFGQVEVDPAVVNLSDAETYYNEKRPFFMEGASIFDYGQGGANNNWNFGTNSPSLFYTRRIGRAPQGSTPDDAEFVDRPAGAHILGAAKLTGKMGDNWNIGTVHALTSNEYARVAEGARRFDYLIEPLTYYGIARARKELNNSSASIGFMATLTERSMPDDAFRNQLNTNAAVGGVDGWMYLDKDAVWALTGWSAVSRIAGTAQRMVDVQRNSVHYFQRDDAGYLGVDSTAGSLTGYAGRFALNKQKGNFEFNAALAFVSPKFDANDAGFQWRSDNIYYHVLSGYKWTEPGDVFRYMQFDASYYQSFDYGMHTTDAGVFALSSLTFKNYYSLQCWIAANPNDSYFKDQTRGGPLMIRPRWTEIDVNAGSDQQKQVSLSLHAHGVNMRPSWFYSASISLQWRAAGNIMVSLTPSYSRNDDAAQWIDNITDPLAVATYGRRFIFATVDQRTISADMRVNWTFTPELRVQLFVQPLVSHNTFAGFKELARPGSNDFVVYGVDAGTWDPAAHAADPDGAGPAPSIAIGDKDFTYKGLRGNLILRWEYRPGSTFYLVWTQSRNDDKKTDGFTVGASASRLLDLQADNIVLLKWSHYFTL
jgi:hypothetical protein